MTKIIIKTHNFISKSINIILPILGLFTLLLVSNTVLFCAFDLEYTISKTFSLIRTVTFELSWTVPFLILPFGVLKSYEVLGVNGKGLLGRFLYNSRFLNENNSYYIVDLFINRQDLKQSLEPFKNYQYQYSLPWFLDPFQLFSHIDRSTVVSKNTALTPVSPKVVTKYIIKERFYLYHTIHEAKKEARELKNAINNSILKNNGFGLGIQSLKDELNTIATEFSKKIHFIYFRGKKVYYTGYVSKPFFTFMLRRPQDYVYFSQYFDFEQKFPILSKILETFYDYSFSTLESNFIEVRITLDYKIIPTFFSTTSKLNFSKCRLQARAFSEESSYVKKNTDFAAINVPLCTEGLDLLVHYLDNDKNILNEVVQKCLNKVDQIAGFLSTEDIIMSKIGTFLNESELETLCLVSKSGYQPFLALEQAYLNKTQPDRLDLLDRQINRDPSQGVAETKVEVYNPTTGQDIIPESSSLSTTLGAALAVGTLGISTTIPMDQFIQIFNVLFGNLEIANVLTNPVAVSHLIDVWNQKYPGAQLPEMVEQARIVLNLPLPNAQDATYTTIISSYITWKNVSYVVLGGLVLGGTYYCIKNGIPFTFTGKEPSVVTR